MLILLFQNLCMLTKKHAFITVLAVIFAALILIVFGKIAETTQQKQAAAQEFDIPPGKETQYFTCVNDGNFRSYLNSDPDKLFKKFAKFKQLLLESDRFTFISISDQYVYLYSREMPEPLRCGYEDGEPTQPFYRYGVMYQSVKAIEVSASFFSHYDIKLSSDEAFSESDYHYERGKPIPVLLGSEYSGIFSIGDVFDGDYIEEVSFVVKGFIEEGARFDHPTRRESTLCDRYMVLPSLSFSIENKAFRFALSQTAGGYIFSSLGYDETLAQFAQYMEQAELTNTQAGIFHPNAPQIGGTIGEMYSVMTKEVARHFAVMLVIITLFGVISVTLMLWKTGIA